MKIELTEHEMRFAAQVGAERYLRSSLSDAKPAAGATRSWDIDINGAMAEMAAAKALGLYWGATVNNFDGPDIGAKTQVRWTPRHNGRLILRQDDNPEHYFILVTGEPPHLTVQGWIIARDGMRGEFVTDAGVDDRPEAWFVPQWALRPLPSLGARHERAA